MIAKAVIIILSCFAVFQHSLATSIVGLCADASGTATNAVCPLACQFSNNGSFTSNAFSCSDQLASDTCATLFPCSGSCNKINGLSTVSSMIASSQPYVRAYACTATSTQTLALQCAYTCGICCLTAAYNCSDNSKSPIDCSANLGNCKSAAFKDIMTQYCPYTCGLCGGSCVDNVTGCTTLVGLCQNINWYTYMSQNCASTCGMCNSTASTTSSSSSCSDIASNCAANSGLCNNSVYYNLMTQQCPRTCGRCSSSSSSTTCTDSSSSCTNWVANGFCSSSFYTTAYKKQYCAKSCSLC